MSQLTPEEWERRKTRFVNPQAQKPRRPYTTTPPTVRLESGEKIGRNAPCPCGLRTLKFKNCHGSTAYTP